MEAWWDPTWRVAVRWLPGMTRQKFARSTVAEIEDRIAGAKFRYELARDLFTWNAIASIAKWTDDADRPQPLTLRMMLGRDAMDLDERVTEALRRQEAKSPYEMQVEAESKAAAQARLEQIRARRRERKKT